MPAFHVEFYPYSGLTHTIRLRGGLALVRLAAFMRNAPPHVLESLAAVLLGRLFRSSFSKSVSESYLSFVRSPSLQRKLIRHKRKLAPKAYQPAGKRYHLRKLFSRLNRAYFRGRLKVPRLGWTGRQARTILGRFDPIRDAITLSSFLDRQEVPRFVTEFVLFHEMLHLAHPSRRSGWRCRFHTPEFRNEEKRFRNYSEATRYLRHLR
jgi:hypothetical protein